MHYIVTVAAAAAAAATRRNTRIIIIRSTPYQSLGVRRVTALSRIIGPLIFAASLPADTSRTSHPQNGLYIYTYNNSVAAVYTHTHTRIRIRREREREIVCCYEGEVKTVLSRKHGLPTAVHIYIYNVQTEDCAASDDRVCI